MAGVHPLLCQPWNWVAIVPNLKLRLQADEVEQRRFRPRWAPGQTACGLAVTMAVPGCPMKIRQVALWVAPVSEEAESGQAVGSGDCGLIIYPVPRGGPAE